MDDPHDDHETPIKTPKQLIAVVLAAFLVPIIVIVLLVNYVGSVPRVGEGSLAMTSAETLTRIAPVAHVQMADTAGTKTEKSGDEVFKAVCSTCHAAGIAGAPKLGDGAAWAARIKQGASILYSHAIEGFQGKSGVMPAKGGGGDLDDLEVQRAVVYMANGSGAKFPAPVAAAGPATPSAAAPQGPVAPVAPPAVIAAVAAANASAAPAAAGAGAADPGQKLYSGICIACHGQGIGGAPKFGDKPAWATRIAEGQATLYEHALKGFQGKSGVMPPKGGSSASDDDVKAAVRYMMNAVK
jgi:cytochrome c5